MGLDYETQEGIIQPSLQENNQGLYGYFVVSNRFNKFNHFLLALVFSRI